jgi:hypothetical protein
VEGAVSAKDAVVETFDYDDDYDAKVQLIMDIRKCSEDEAKVYLAQYEASGHAMSAGGTTEENLKK